MTYHCNSDGKPGVFDQARNDETDPGRLRRRPTTGSSSVATKTGNTYISGTKAKRMTDLTASYGYFTTSTVKKLTLGDCDNDRQPEIAI